MLLRHSFILALLLLPLFATAQESSAVLAARNHFLQNASAHSFSSDDLSDLRARDVAPDARRNLTHVTFTQHTNGIEIWGTQSSAAVTSSGRVHAVADRFVSNVASRANATAPVISSQEALSAAQRTLAPHLSTSEASLIPAHSDAPGEAVPTQTEVSWQSSDASPYLVYQPRPDGSLRLAWVVELPTSNNAHHFIARVDAVNGNVLAADDLVVHEHLGMQDVHREVRPTSFAPIRSGSYSVVELPNEFPDGPLQTVTNPHDPEASPDGWHEVRGVTYETTRGNNTHAYFDFDADNSPDLDNRTPEGGSDLQFTDLFYDPDYELLSNAEAGLVNLFYWNSLMHDWLYHYGFDEAAGNFQAVNYTDDGTGGDEVNAEALDGSGVNNANFMTLPDGNSGRMQMFRWPNPDGSRSLSWSDVNLDSNEEISFALFGPGNLESPIVATVAVTEPRQACESLTNPDDVANAIALIERGTCTFRQKIKNAQDAGAIGVVIHNDDRPDQELLNMSASTNVGGEITIPAVFIDNANGLALRNSLPVTATLNLTSATLDGSFDAGVVSHEYIHGLSTRLTGGASSVSCLGNDEQMGEGWSDYYALMATMREGDTRMQPRTIASYLARNEEGIRRHPFSTDMSVNPLTYADLEDVRTVDTIFGETVVPHDVGEIWVMMLWEMTWDLIDTHGFSADIFNADGTAGNQIALNLVTEGLKLQPCSPGFVDGRDAILEADSALYNGEYSDTIWRAFARRGLGDSAIQGDPDDHEDGTEAYDLPEGVEVASEAGPRGRALRLTMAGPNPAREHTMLHLTADTDQTVHAELFDALGRRVAELHNGPAVSGIPLELAVDASALPSGVYVVHVEGETFSVSRRITIAR